MASAGARAYSGGLDSGDVGSRGKALVRGSVSEADDDDDDDDDDEIDYFTVR